MYDMTDNQKLKNVVNYLVFQGRVTSVADFADKIGQNRSGVSEKINGRKPVTEAFVLRLTKAFPEINPDYLLDVDCDKMLSQGQQIVVNGYGNQTAGRDINVASPSMLEEPEVPYGRIPDYEKRVEELQGYIAQLNEHIKHLTEIISKLAGGQQL